MRLMEKLSETGRAIRSALLWALFLPVFTACGDRPDAPVVLAAASLQPAMEEVARAWENGGREAPVLSFAASSALARQIEAGAPADLFLSADEDWARYLEERALVEPGSHMVLLGNRLVLVAAKDAARRINIGPGFPLAETLGEERLAIADPDSVPAGKYAKAALQSLGVWDGVADRLAPMENVRAALAMVERGQAPLGIVYATDAQGSDRVRVVGVFPPGRHPPIRYPLVTIKGSVISEAEDFREFLLSAGARAIFARYGFDVP